MGIIMVVQCNGCAALVWPDHEGPVSRSSRSAAERIGWRRDGYMDLCPACWENRNAGHRRTSAGVNYT